MISAPFLPGCPSAIDRVAWSLVSRGAIDTLAWPLSGIALVLFLLPALVVATAAVWAWHSQSRNVAALVFLGALAVHLPLVLAIAPLLLLQRAQSDERAEPRSTTLLRAAVVISAATAILVWATPACQADRSADAIALAWAIVGTLRIAAGAIVVLLGALETIRNASAAETRVAWAVVLAACVAGVVFQDYDGRLTLIPAAVALWWLAARGACSLIRDSRSRVGRVAAVALFALVPLLQTAEVMAAGKTASREPPTTAQAIVDALDRMWTPAAVVAEDTAHDWLVTLWRTGARSRMATLQFVDSSGEGIREHVTDRAIYAFARSAEGLRERGLLVAPVNTATPAATPVLSRVLASSGCQRLTSAWQDVTSMAADGQMSAVFSRGGAGPHAIIYAAVPRDATITQMGWAPMANTGYRATGFDLTDRASRFSLYETATADGLSLSRLPSSTSYVAKLRIEHIERQPGALSLAFDVAPATMIARVESASRTASIELCRSTRDLAIVGYREAPRVTRIDVSSPANVGHGWYANERAGDVRFRWTAAPEAELRFLAIQPAPLVLHIAVLDAAGGGSREPASVSLNGVPAQCDRNAAECEWMLPAEAMVVGLNVLTLSAPVVRASRADARGLGLKIASAELHYLGLTGRDFLRR